METDYLNYKTITFNCKGLNNLIKVKQASKTLIKEYPDILFLQETHLKAPVKQILKTQ